MRIPESLPLKIRELRAERALTQTALAQAAGVSQQFISCLERGETRGTRDLLRRVCAALGVADELVLRATGWIAADVGRPSRQFANQVEARFAPSGVYVPRFDRSFSSRIYSLRQDHPEVIARLERVLDRRPDLPELERSLAEMPTDSRDEALFLLSAASLGARGTTLAPARLGCGPLDIRERHRRRFVGHRLMHCLVLTREPRLDVLFPLVPLMVGKLPFRVDALVGSQGPGGPLWSIWEVDGSGHDFRRDEERTEALRLPCRRIGGERLLRPDFPQWLLGCLDELYFEATASQTRRFRGRRAA